MLAPDAPSVFHFSTGAIVSRQPYSLREMSSPVYSLAFSNDGRFLASGRADGTIQLWDLKSRSVLHAFGGRSGRHTDKVTAIALSRDDRVLISGSNDKTVKLWDVPTGRMRKVMEQRFARSR